MNKTRVVSHRRWLWCTLTFTLVLSYDSLVATGASDDLSEFLLPIRKQADSEFIPRIAADKSAKRRSGILCSSQQGIRICTDPVSGEAVSFTLFNLGSPHIVPHGQSFERSYRLKFEGRYLQNIKMTIFEQPSPTERASHSLMRTSIYFFPRKVIPTLSLIENNSGRDVLELELPTGERVCFDRENKEIIGGVLNEDAPIDANPDRHNRRFAQVSYKGGGITIRVDQRGSTPEKAVVWGQKKMATISFGNRTCKLSPEKLWEQDSGWFDFMFPTDTILYKFLRKSCDWNDIELPTDLPASSFSCREALESPKETDEKQ